MTEALSVEARKNKRKLGNARNGACHSPSALTAVLMAVFTLTLGVSPGPSTCPGRVQNLDPKFKHGTDSFDSGRIYPFLGSGNKKKQKKRGKWKPSLFGRSGQVDPRKAVQNIFQRFEAKYQDNPEMMSLMKGYKQNLKDRMGPARPKKPPPKSAKELKRLEKINRKYKRNLKWNEDFDHKTGFANMATQRNLRFMEQESRLRELQDEWEREENKEMQITKARSLAILEGKQPGLGIQKRREELGIKADENFNMFQSYGLVKAVESEGKTMLENWRYCYEDASGKLQGPFSVKRLKSWRDSLPMDLPLRKYLNDKQKLKFKNKKFNALGDTEEENESEIESSDANSVDPPLDVKDNDLDRNLIEYANVVGDSLLLEHWRQTHPEKSDPKVSGYCNSPTATAYWKEVNSQSSVTSASEDKEAKEENVIIPGLMELASLSDSKVEEEIQEALKESMTKVKPEFDRDDAEGKEGLGYMKCVEKSGVLLRKSSNLNDMAELEKHGLVDFGETVYALERKDGAEADLLKLKNGLWVPARIGNKTMFEDCSTALLLRKNDNYTMKKYVSDSEDERTAIQVLKDELVTAQENPDLLGGMLLHRSGRPGYMYDPKLCNGINLDPNRTNEEVEGLIGPFYPTELYKLRAEAAMDMPIYYYDGHHVHLNMTMNFADVVGDSALLEQYQRDESIEKSKRSCKPGLNTKPTALRYWDDLFQRQQKADTKLSAFKKANLFSPTLMEIQGQTEENFGLHHQRSEGEGEIVLPPRHHIVPRKMARYNQGELVQIAAMGEGMEEYEGRIGRIAAPFEKGQYQVALESDEEKEIVLVRPDQILPPPADVKEQKKAAMKSSFLEKEQRGIESLMNLMPMIHKKEIISSDIKKVADALRENIIFFRRKAEELSEESNLKKLAGSRLNESLSTQEKLELAEKLKGELVEGFEMHYDAGCDLVYYHNPQTGHFLRHRPIKIHSLSEISQKEITLRESRIKKRKYNELRTLRIAARRALGKAGSETGDTDENPFRDASWSKAPNATDWAPMTWQDFKLNVSVRFNPARKAEDRRNFMKDLLGTVLGPYYHGGLPEGQVYVEPTAEVLVQWAGKRLRAHPLSVLLVHRPGHKKNIEAEILEELEEGVNQKKAEYAERLKRMVDLGFKNEEANFAALERHEGDVYASINDVLVQHHGIASGSGSGSDGGIDMSDSDRELNVRSQAQQVINATFKTNQLGVHEDYTSGRVHQGGYRFMDLSDEALAAERHATAMRRNVRLT